MIAEWEKRKVCNAPSTAEAHGAPYKGNPSPAICDWEKRETHVALQGRERKETHREKTHKDNPQHAIGDGAPGLNNLHMVCKPLLMMKKEKESQQSRVLSPVFKAKIATSASSDLDRMNISTDISDLIRVCCSPDSSIGNVGPVRVLWCHVTLLSQACERPRQWRCKSPLLVKSILLSSSLLYPQQNWV